MITYHLDYRSPPSGLGTITLENGDKILIQSQDEQIEVKEGIYSKIIVLNQSFEDLDSLQKEEIQTLRDHGVSHVYDPEEWGAATDSNGYMHILDFVRSRGF
jgi:thiamine pyrophosphokinase